MRIDPSERILYEWGGWWLWYHRLIALVVYATGLLLVGLCFPARDLMLEPSFGNIVLLALLITIIVAWVFVIRISWRDGQSRVSRITLLPEKDALLVRTLNFGSRLVPITALEKFRFTDLKNDVNDYRVPILMVDVSGGPRLTIDLEGQILDEETFDTIFHYRPTRPPKGRMNTSKTKRKLVE